MKFLHSLFVLSCQYLACTTELEIKYAKDACDCMNNLKVTIIYQEILPMLETACH